MAYGNLNVDVVQSSTAGTPTQFKDGNGTQVGTLCRAWVCWNGTNGAIFSSFNVSSVTRTGTGQYTVTFSSAFANTNYSVTGTSSTNGSYNSFFLGPSAGSKTTTTSSIVAISTSASVTDPNEMSLQIFA